MCNKLNLTQIAVVPNTSVTITVSPTDLDNGKAYPLVFCIPKIQEELFNTIVGNEPITIEVGAGGKKYPVVTNLANMFYSGRLHLGYCYRLIFANDGMPGKITHFTCVNTPCTNKFNPGNTNIS